MAESFDIFDAIDLGMKGPTVVQNWCMLGDVWVSASGSPKSWSERVEQEFAEHSNLGDRPMIQNVGGKLDEITIEWQTSASMSDFGKMWDKLLEYKEAGASIPVTMGDGEYLGRFVITSMSFDRVGTFKNGTTHAANVKVSLKEYAEHGPLIVIKKPKPISVKKTVTTKKTYSRDKEGYLVDETGKRVGATIDGKPVPKA